MTVLATFSEAACPGYHFFAIPEIQPGLDDAASIITTLRADERRKAVESAIAFIQENYNEFGEWDDIAFNDLRAAILGESTP